MHNKTTYSEIVPKGVSTTVNQILVAALRSLTNGSEAKPLLIFKIFTNFTVNYTEVSGLSRVKGDNYSLAIICSARITWEWISPAHASASFLPNSRST